MIQNSEIKIHVQIVIINGSEISQEKTIVWVLIYLRAKTKLQNIGDTDWKKNKKKYTHIVTLFRLFYCVFDFGLNLNLEATSLDWWNNVPYLLN